MDSKQKKVNQTRKKKVLAGKVVDPLRVCGWIHLVVKVVLRNAVLNLLTRGGGGGKHMHIQPENQKRCLVQLTKLAVPAWSRSLSEPQGLLPPVPIQL